MSAAPAEGARLTVETFPTKAGTPRYSAVLRWEDGPRQYGKRCGHLHWTNQVAWSCGRDQWAGRIG